MLEQKKKRQRRLIGIGLLIVSLLGFAWFLQYQRDHLQNDSFTSGYVLIAAVFFLASYNLRKKLPFLPALGSSRVWMQIHIYVGFGSIAVFAMHMGLKFPNGLLETILASLFSVVALSGIYGLYVTRTVPKKLTHLNDEAIFEEIPRQRFELTRQVHELMNSIVEQSETLARFYANRLAPFFEQPRPLAYFVRPSARQSRKLQQEIQQLDRYLNHDQRQVGDQLVKLVQRKDNLDYHRAMQGRLKYWLFLHIGLTYSLLIVSVVHGVMAHAFHGGIR